MALIRRGVIVLLFSLLFVIADSSPKWSEKNQVKEIFENEGKKQNGVSSSNLEPRILHFEGNYPPEVLETLQETLLKMNSPNSIQIDKLIPDRNKVIFTVQLREPMSGLDVIQDLSEAVAKHSPVELDSVKVGKYESYNGKVKMFFIYHTKRPNSTDGEMKQSSDSLEHLTVKKRMQNEGGNVKIMDILNGKDSSYQYSNGKKITVQSIFSDKHWEAWQLAVLISACLFVIFCIFVLIMFVNSDRITKNKIKPLEEPRHVVLQPILRPVVADVGIIQPQLEVKDHNVAPVDTDSETAPSPSRSPMRRGRGLLERRGSNASLTLDLNRSQENILCCTPPKECSAEEYLQSASKRMTRRQLRSSLRDVKALHTEFWEIPMNHPEKVEIAGCGTKNRYKTILPNETTRVHLYEKSGDPLSSYINANYIRGYSGEVKAYIATQGPLAHTVNDFWQMVWKEKSPLIVMITKLKEKMKVKCEPYIPDYQDHYEEIEVTVMRVIPRDGYTVRELYLRRGTDSHIVHHFWYTTWPDHKTPSTAKQLLGMALEAESMRVNNRGINKGPMIVHCSAGIGRTGCFIATSIGIQQLLEENYVDILGTVCSLRLDRGGMIQTAEQYEFVHQALSIFELTIPGTMAGE